MSVARDFRRSSRRGSMTANDASGCCTWKTTRTLEFDEEHQAYREGQLISKHDGIRGNHPLVNLANQLSGNNDYVRRWLAQTDEKANQHRPEYCEVRQRTPNNGEPKTHIDFGLRYHALKEEFSVPLSRRKRRHKSSSDSSLLESPVRPKSQALRGSDSETEKRARKEESAQLRKKQKTESFESRTSTCSLESPPAKKDAFERRARHKTREDRYEPMAQLKRRQNDDEAKRPRKKRGKKGDRKRAANRAGEDLIRKFSSKSIGQERLTLHPSLGLGLFKNGRASSPVQHRVPDLAFSEMDFLQRTSRQVSSMAEDKIISKSREKEKRKAFRAQDEISTFFKQKKIPLQSEKLNKGSEPSPTHKKDYHSGYINPANPDFPQRHHERSLSLDFRAQPNQDFGKFSSTSDVPFHSLRRSPMTSHSRNVVDSASKLSGRAISYISWSETQISQGATSRNLSNTSRKRASPTPEPIRRLLEKTGIFRDTGISLPSRPAGVSFDVHKILSKQDQNRATATATTVSRTGLPESIGLTSSCARARSRVIQSLHIGSQSDVQGEAHVPNIKYFIRHTEAQNEEDVAIKHKGAIVEHSDPVSEWHERRMTGGYGQGITVLATKRDASEQPKASLINRMELAKIARIKRPSTTIPPTQMPFDRQRATIRDTGDHHMEQGLQRISASDMADRTSSPRPIGSNEEPVYEATLKVLPHESSRPRVLELNHHKVDNPSVPDWVTNGKGVLAPHHLSHTINLNLNQERPSELQNSIDTQHDNNSTFLRLPVRGFLTGRGQLQTARHADASLVADHQPYYVHQLQQHSAFYKTSDYDDHLRKTEYEEFDKLARAEATTELDGFKCNTVQEEVEDLSHLYETADDYVNTALQQTYEEFEDHSKGHERRDLRHWRSSHIDIGLEPYGLEEPGQELYEGNQTVEDMQTLQSFVHDHTFVEQEDNYEPYRLAKSDDTRVFWRPYLQY